MREVVDAPVQAMLGAGPIWAILFIAMAVGGIVVQIMSTRMYVPETYENRI